jgi:hypothetical protein
VAVPTVASNGGRAASLGAITLPNPFAVSAAADDLQLWNVETLDEDVTLNAANGAAILATGVSSATGETRVTPIWRLFASQADVTILDPGDHVHARGLTIQGQHLTDPFHQVTTGVLAADTAISIVTGMTTTADECLIVLLITSLGPDISATDSTEFNNPANTNLTSVAEVFDSLANQNAGNGIACWTGELASAGAVGTFTGDSDTSTPKAWACIAIQPPAAAAGGSSVGALAGEGGNASALRGGNAGVGGGNAAFEMVRGIWQQRPRLVPVGLTLRGA